MEGLGIVRTQIRKRLLIPCVTLALTMLVVGLIGQGIADVAAQAGQTRSLDRDLEPVVVKGSQVPALDGAPLGQLFVYRYSGNTLNGPIPAQVDEVTSGGDYTASEDGLLDANDEIVFMAKDTGDQPSDTSGLGSFTTWYEIEVVDPLNPAHKGWAYLVRRSPTSVGGNYVDYNTSTWRITTTPNNYELGFATTGHIGFDNLTLNGSGTDILDRTKLRVTRPSFPTVNENAWGAPEPIEVIDGRVRVIVQRGAGFGLVDLTTTYLAYSSMVQSFAEVNSSVSVSKVRTSVDLNVNVSGATFYNANTPGGVTINGSPDSVAATPFSNWTQVSHTSGRLVQVGDPAPAGGTPKNYYCDDTTSTEECDATGKTGDNVSYGDSGTMLEGSVNRTFTIFSSLYVLPPAGGGQDKVGATYEEYFFHPLQVAAYLEGERSRIFLPIILKNRP